MQVVTLRYPLLALPVGLARESALKVIGGNVRRERTAANMSQDKLAERAGIYVRTVARIEAGQLNVRPETLLRIRDAIDCPLTRLLGPYGKLHAA